MPYVILFSTFCRIRRGGKRTWGGGDERLFCTADRWNLSGWSVTDWLSPMFSQLSVA